MQEDINKTIADNTGLIFKQLKKFYLTDDPEAESIGYEALYHAILNFDQEKNIQFSTYASVCIYNALGTYIRTLRKQRQLEVISYHNIAYSEDGTDCEYESFLSDSVDVESRLLKQELCEAVQKEFQRLYDKLTNEKHKVILTIWRDSEFKASMITVAKEAGVSQPYVSQVINSFKHKMKENMEEYYYD